MKIFVLMLSFFVMMVTASDLPIEPLQPSAVKDDAKIALGKKLFNEPALSKSGVIACASCHKQAYGGADHEVISYAIGCLNAPSIYNLDGHLAMGWGGDSDSIRGHIGMPLKNKMGGSPEGIIAFVNANEALKSDFLKTYGKVDEEVVMDSLAVYITSLKTTGSRFDRYLEGDASAIDAQEKRGYRKFVDFGCTSCHNGANVGGNAFMKLGIFIDPSERFDGNCTFGRYDYTGIEEDKFVFKVPSLRNVSKTAPYFHDGSAATLKEAINLMAEYQLGHPLKPEDVEDIAAFLKTLEADPDEK